MLDEIGSLQSKDILKAIRSVKVSCIKEDEQVLRPLLELLKVRMTVETMHDTSRVRGHPTRIIITFEGIELKLIFRKLREMRHIPPLEELKVKFETPTSKTVLEQATLTKISQRIDELV